MAVLQDDSVMTFGKFKGKTMEDVPAWYLLYMKGLLEKSARLRNLYDNEKEVLEYIQDNIDVLDKQAKEENIYKKKS